MPSIPEPSASGRRRASTRGLDPSRAVLANGLTVLARQTRKTPAVTLSLALRAGSVCDPPDLPGAVYLLSKLLDRGTSSRTAAEIAEALESRGNTLGVTVNRHLCTLSCTCLCEDVEPLVTILAEILMSPIVPQVELETRRLEVVTAIRQDEDSPFACALDRVLALMYGAEHPYGRPVKGLTPSVERMTRDHLLALHAERFVPSALTVVVVGDIDPLRAIELTEQAFGRWHRPSPAPPALEPPAPSRQRRRVTMAMPDKAQADVAYGFVTMARSDPAYYAAALMNNILGQYALGGRLGDRIREKQGMAYYCSSVFDAAVVAGPLVVRAGVAAQNVEAVVRAIDEELEKLRRDGVTEAEITESRQYLIGSMPRALETNAGIANFLQTSELFGLGIDHDIRLPQLLEQVGRDEVNEAARRLLDPARATIVVAGPPTT